MMISDELFEQVIDAYANGDEAALERFEAAGVPVMVVLFVSCEGGGVVYDDAGLMERLG
jgi:hypothetical protein